MILTAARLVAVINDGMYNACNSLQTTHRDIAIAQDSRQDSPDSWQTYYVSHSIMQSDRNVL